MEEVGQVLQECSSGVGGSQTPEKTGRLGQPERLHARGLGQERLDLMQVAEVDGMPAHPVKAPRGFEQILASDGTKGFSQSIGHRMEGIGGGGYIRIKKARRQLPGGDALPMQGQQGQHGEGLLSREAGDGSIRSLKLQPAEGPQTEANRPLGRRSVTQSETMGKRDVSERRRPARQAAHEARSRGQIRESHVRHIEEQGQRRRRIS
ncbi:hypothetical protein D3C72_1463500 [compost metagenome]